MACSSVPVPRFWAISRSATAPALGAGSVVLKEVPPRTTVAGVPAKVIGEAGCAQPALVMDHVVMVHDAG